LGNSFGEPFWGTDLKYNSFGNRFAAVLWGTALSNNYRELLWGVF